MTTRTAWRAKADIVAATGIPEREWNTAISDLISGGKVERQGEKFEAKYRALIREKSI